MTNWLPSAQEYLKNKDYDNVVSLYENIIANEPETIDHYFYLGLAYLLQKEEEEAQNTWFYVFCQADEEETVLWQKMLIDILDTEANSQDDNQTAQLIRFHLQQIAPDNLNNVLYLVQLQLSNKSFDFKRLHEWDVFTLLSETTVKEYDYVLLINVLIEILQIPYAESIDFLRLSLKIISQSENLLKQSVAQIVYVGNKLGYNPSKILHGANILEECLVYEPNNIDIVRDLYLIYKCCCKWEKSLEYHLLLDNLSLTLPQQLHSKFLRLNLCLTMSDWNNVGVIYDEYKHLLLKMIEENPIIEDEFVRDCFLVITQPILYIQDNQSENRHLINHFAKIFQSHAQSHICCPVDFIPSQRLTTNKKLKIAYLGHTLRTHSVGLLSRWLMQHHDRKKFEVYTYLLNQKEDEITQKWFKEKADVCRHLPRNTRFSLAQIKEDEIDILIDLDSLTHNLTNLIMSLKPAPVQITWLGLDATGIPNIDYFVADDYVLTDDAQEYYQEKIWRLPNCYLGVDGFEVDVANISRQELDVPTDAVVYLNMQNSLKRHPDMIHLQMKIIKAVPNSYLFIKGNGDQKVLKELFISIAQQEAVEENRLRFLPQTPTEAIHRANLKIADVVLDTYPYNGATTTLETLWMEVPLVSRVGEQFAARNSYTFMKNAGITEGIAWSDEEYIDWGIKLGTDEQLRKEVSWKLKQSKKTSPLWNGKQFTKEMEKAYQQMWKIYVDEKKKKDSN